MSLITISGGKGCGAVQVARLVSEAANLDLYDDRRLQQEAVKFGIHSEDLKNLGEKAPGFFDVLLGRRPEVYLDLMESLIYEVSRSGRGVIVGHGSQFLLRDFGCAFHVLIHASGSYRIKQMMDRQGLSRQAAEKMISKSDHERRGFLRFAFRLEWSDPSLYDLVINTEKFGVEGASNLIVDALKSSAIQECSLHALESMERMSLMKKVEAALLKQDFSLTQFHVEVPEKGVAKIYGYTNTAENKKQMLEISRKVPGVSEIIEEIGVLPPGAY
jgi:cytidylate kinase